MVLFSAHYALFLGAALALIITPGPDMVYIVSRGIVQGRAAGVLSALGVCCGVIVHTLAAALGLALLLQTSMVAYYTVKYMGAVYLIYLGVKNLAGKQNLSLNKTGMKQSSGSLFWQGFVTDVLNPKMALFFLSFLPQFIDHRAAMPALQMIVLGLSYFLLSLLVLTVIALLSGKIGSMLSGKQNIGRKIQWLPGCVLIGLGLSMALPGVGGNRP
ncbi:LysE family translocator [Desulfoscipio geothermicus]|uniref:Threonine/homoserine/homoserine lactone efflux protein n=1 Tax=Desulfoscipio geothermicus DSM 3669 TaxID=1121426 RepID=A0A1I6CNG0_9FIRM|nr:LysE family translocator [Desulfoscipio geothermicus]SFQ94724.1 Threonine/homoserine/homoserine lactone efflux protein [Desulfoscipio geothermicus DSM 3669]